MVFVQVIDFISTFVLVEFFSLELVILEWIPFYEIPYSHALEYRLVYLV